MCPPKYVNSYFVAKERIDERKQSNEKEEF